MIPNRCRCTASIMPGCSICMPPPMALSCGGSYTILCVSISSCPDQSTVQYSAAQCYEVPHGTRSCACRSRRALPSIAVQCSPTSLCTLRYSAAQRHAVHRGTLKHSDMKYNAVLYVQCHAVIVSTARHCRGFSTISSCPAVQRR